MVFADHPTISFIEARKTSGAVMYTRGRPDGPPLWIVIHDMEFPERGDAAEWTGNYFATGAGGRSVSSHYCADSNSIVQCVRLSDSAWTVGNRQGNNRGINWELAGYASQTREQWLDPFGKAMLARIAPVMRADALKFGIPLRQLTDADVRAYRPGVTSHWQLGRVFGGTDHTDPGPNFPWDFLMALLTGTEEDDMALRDDPDGLQLIYRVDAVMNDLPVTRGGAIPGEPNVLHQVLAGLREDIDAIKAALAGVPVAAQVDLTPEAVAQVADAVVDEQRDRLAE